MLEWPQHRPSPFAPKADNAQSTGFNSAWNFSAARIQALTTSLTQRLPDEIACVAVSGSLARMEAHDGSDVDLLVVLDDRLASQTEAEKVQLYRTVWGCLEDGMPNAELTPPKAGGVFSSPASWKLLTDMASRGIVNEDMTNYGQRMQIILDAQPVYGNEKFCDLRRELLEWFSESRIASQFSEAGTFHWLEQEVRRYWHSIRARACWLFADQPAQSTEVNIKLRSSRMLLIAAFLRCIHESHTNTKSNGSLEHMLQLLRQTPLEIATASMSASNRCAFLANYETAWEFCKNRQSSTLPTSVVDALEGIRVDLKPLINW